MGNYVLFKAPLGSSLPPDTKLIKQVIAGEGDSVTRKDQDFFINGKWIAKAKTYSRQGEPLIAGPVGILEKGQYYVGTQHQDSFDSRYQRMGWITQDLVLGVAYPLW